MIANKDSVQLSDYCFNLCEELETKIRRENTEEQNAFVGRAIDELGRCVDPDFCPVYSPTQQL